ncbi:hypothetical protein B296_00050246 [Ensete ventricosum]|uniref:Uncharacterized protein n=1 Tax=Ensete ventricosum TaxID=4639 RepID=A0A426X6F5_ENSVE|nr:hypothetical protein B296_00050246 [Ensete ventricosum]
MRLGARYQCVGSSPRVLGVCQDGAREFVGRRPKLVGRLSEVTERLAGSWEAFARTSPKVSGILLEHAGRSLDEDHETSRLEYRRLLDCKTAALPTGGTSQAGGRHSHRQHPYASHNCYPYSLAMGKRHPLQADYRRALPLHLGHGRASPLAGWSWVRTPLKGPWPQSTSLTKGLAVVGRPLSMLPSLRNRSKNA